MRICVSVETIIIFRIFAVIHFQDEVLFGTHLHICTFTLPYMLMITELLMIVAHEGCVVAVRACKPIRGNTPPNCG